MPLFASVFGTSVGASARKVNFTKSELRYRRSVIMAQSGRRHTKESVPTLGLDPDLAFVTNPNLEKCLASAGGFHAGEDMSARAFCSKTLSVATLALRFPSESSSCSFA